MANALRANIPQSRQTDPKFFPDYEYSEYPKLMVDDKGDPIVKNASYLMTSPPLGSHLEPQPVVRNGKKVLLGGDFIIVKNKQEEDAFRGEQISKAAAVNIKPSDIVARAAPAAPAAEAAPAPAAPKAQTLEELASE
jgi:hypothetical protein